MSKPFMFFSADTCKWYARTHKEAVNTFAVSAKCPFVAYMVWMEQAVKEGSE